MRAAASFGRIAVSPSVALLFADNLLQRIQKLKVDNMQLEMKHEEVDFQYQSGESGGCLRRTLTLLARKQVEQLKMMVDQQNAKNTAANDSSAWEYHSSLRYSNFIEETKKIQQKPAVG